MHVILQHLIGSAYYTYKIFVFNYKVLATELFAYEKGGGD